MTYEEKNTWVSIATTLIAFGAFYLYMRGYFSDGSLSGADGLAFFGKAVLALIGLSILLTIICTILFNIIYAIATNDPKPSFVVDERDRLIELRGLKITSYLTGSGFMLAMLLLALGYGVLLVFNIIILSFAAGEVIGSIYKLAIYRRGY